MDKSQVKGKIYNVLQEFNRYGEQFSDATKLDDDLGIDSLGMVMLIAELESTFNIKIDAERERTRANLGTVGSLQELITNKLNLQNS